MCYRSDSSEFAVQSEGAEFKTYQLTIRIASIVTVRIGKLGEFTFPEGMYCYTGSAQRNLEARIARHLRQEKTLRWHIDYLLAAPGVEVIDVQRSKKPECDWNQSVAGEVLVPGMGSSDCRSGCGSHLKFMGRDSGDKSRE